MKGLYQVGYVTRDIERAIELVGSDFDLSTFSHFDVDLQLQTPSGPQVASVRVGTAWAGPMQIELIQPLSGHVGVYLDALPADRRDPTPRFHHLAVRRESVAEMQREVARLGLPLVFETAGAGISSVFVDARARFGHYLEFVAATVDGWAILGWPGATGSPPSSPAEQSG